MQERMYVVTYDVSSPKRWRRVFKLMNGYGQWLQLSVFQCRLTRRRRAEMQGALEAVLHPRDDRLLILDLGPADEVRLRVTSLGGESFQAIRREPMIV